MVRLTPSLLKPRRFIDSVRITARGGRGGNGLPKFGGVGGKGGDVYVEACDNYSLLKLKIDFPSQKFVAGCGEDSRRFRILGGPGKDVIIKCPPGVTAVSDMKHFIGEVNKSGERILLARGGCGGGPHNGFIGQKGQVVPLTLDLKLLADVGFVGFPNAGKSTLLKALSNAKPKIANYPFTTIQPNIGILSYSDFRAIKAADLPGLIEGAHVNYGMGHKFLKHCVRTKILLFVVDINGFKLNPTSPHRNALETLMFLNRELELYNKELVHKPAILAINKLDTDEDGSKFEKLKDELKQLKYTSNNFPDEMRPDFLMSFDSVVPISALTGMNITFLKDKIRTIIDIHHEEQTRKEIESNVIQRNESVIYV